MPPPEATAAGPVPPPGTKPGTGYATRSATSFQRAEHERDALMRVAVASAAAATLDDVLELIAEAAHAVLGQGSLSISRWDEDLRKTQVMINVGELGPDEVRRPDEEWYEAADYPELEWMRVEQRPYFTAVDDPDGDPAAIALLERLHKESAIGVPVVVEGSLWGEVWATTPLGAPRFRGRDVRFLEAIAAQLAAITTRVELFSRVSRMAYEDALTSLPNRRALEEFIDRGMAKHLSVRRPLALLICDVDRFKQINDERGHDAGDAALRRVGSALIAAASPHPGAMVGRLSGDEFAVVLDGVGLDAAREVAQEALELLAGGTSQDAISLSCGAAEAQPRLADRKALLRDADTALYAAKRRGGGRVCTASGDGVAAQAPDDGALRVRAHEGLELGTATLLAQLDGELADAATLDRLEAVGIGYAELLNAAGWAISFAPHGSPKISAVCTADDRDRRLAGVRVGLEHETYEIARFPLTERLIHRGTGTFVVESGRPGADPAESGLLAELGFTALLGAAVSDREGVYLVELYGDEDSAVLGAAELRIDLIVRIAGASRAPSADPGSRAGASGDHVAAMGEIGTRLAGAVDEQEIVAVAIEGLTAGLGFEMCGVQRLNSAGRVELVGARGEGMEQDLAEGWSQPVGLGLVGRALREREVVRVGDVSAEPDYRSTLQTRAIGSEMCAPLWAGERLWGAIDIAQESNDAFGPEDEALVRTVAEQVSAALRCAALYEQLESAYLGTAEALGAALEAKHEGTARHSRSICANAVAVAAALGLDEDAVRTVRLAAAFHDIGKIAVPEAILNKPAPLSDEERGVIELHTLAGEQILAPIEFLAAVRPLVRGGHERWDGGGYPDGLRGEEIPVGARIVFACDAYDAMTSDRPYRPALDESEARERLRAGAGSQFDPAVVEALISALDSAASVA